MWHKVLHISLRWIFAFLLCRYVIPAALRMRYVGRATLCGCCCCCCCICYFANLLQIFTYDLLFERAAFARTHSGGGRGSGACLGVGVKGFLLRSRRGMAFKPGTHTGLNVCVAESVRNRAGQALCGYCGNMKLCL